METLSHINPEFARTSRGSGTRQKGHYVSERAHYVYRPVPQHIIQGYCKENFAQSASEHRQQHFQRKNV